MTLTIRNGAKAAALAGLASAGIAFAQPALAEMSVRGFVLTTGVTNREPVDKVDSIQAKDGAGKAVIFARVSNPDAREQVTFVWYKGDKERARKAVNIGTSTGWRTWSSSSVDIGSWHVDLVGKDGKVLAQKAFAVVGAEAPAEAPAPAAAPAPQAQPEPAPAPPIQPPPAAPAEGSGSPMQNQESGGAPK